MKSIDTGRQLLKHSFWHERWAEPGLLQVPLPDFLPCDHCLSWSGCSAALWGLDRLAIPVKVGPRFLLAMKKRLETNGNTTTSNTSIVLPLPNVLHFAFGSLRILRDLLPEASFIIALVIIFCLSCLSPQEGLCSNHSQLGNIHIQGSNVSCSKMKPLICAQAATCSTRGRL